MQYIAFRIFMVIYSVWVDYCNGGVLKWVGNVPCCVPIWCSTIGDAESLTCTRTILFDLGSRASVRLGPPAVSSR